MEGDIYLIEGQKYHAWKAFRYRICLICEKKYIQLKYKLKNEVNQGNGVVCKD